MKPDEGILTRIARVGFEVGSDVRQRSSRSIILFLRQAHQTPSLLQIDFPARDFAPLLFRPIQIAGSVQTFLERAANTTSTFSGWRTLLEDA